MFEPLEVEDQNTPLQYAVYLLSLVVALCWAGWVFAALWEWFIFPVIPVRQIAIPEAIGFIVIVGLLFGKSSDKELELTWDIIQNKMIDWVMRPLVALVCGAIVNTFV